MFVVVVWRRGSTHQGEKGPPEQQRLVVFPRGGVPVLDERHDGFRVLLASFRAWEGGIDVPRPAAFVTSHRPWPGRNQRITNGMTHSDTGRRVGPLIDKPHNRRLPACRGTIVIHHRGPHQLCHQHSHSIARRCGQQSITSGLFQNPLTSAVLITQPSSFAQY